MNVSLMERPAPSEYSEYYETYIGKVPEGNVCDIMEAERKTTLALLADVDETQADFRYAPGKWSIKGVVGHVIDCDRDRIGVRININGYCRARRVTVSVSDGILETIDANESRIGCIRYLVIGTGDRSAVSGIS